MCLFKRWTKLQIEAKTKNEFFFASCLHVETTSIDFRARHKLHGGVNKTHPRKRDTPLPLQQDWWTTEAAEIFSPTAGAGDPYHFYPFLYHFLSYDIPRMHLFCTDPFINEIQGDFFFLHLQNKKRDEGLLMGFYFIKTFWGLFLLSRRFFSGGNHPVTFRWINDPQTAKPRRWKHDKTCGDCKGLFWKKCPHQTPKKSEKLNLSLFKKNQQHLCSSLSPDLSQLHEHSKKKWRVRVACMWGWRIHPSSLADSSPLKNGGLEDDPDTLRLWGRV